MTNRICAAVIPAQSPRGEGKWLVHAVAALALVMATVPQVPLLAQGLNSEEAIDKIIGSQVDTEEHKADAEADRVIAAVEGAHEIAEKVRMAFNLNELKIVFLPDVDGASSAIGAAIDKHETEIEALREAIEGSAMFFHAIDSRSIQLANIVALEFGENETATIFVAGQDPNKPVD